MSILIDLFFINRVLDREVTKPVTYPDRYLNQLIPIIPMWASVFFIYDIIFTRIINTGHFIGTIGYFIMCSFGMVIPMYWLSSIEITIKKKQDSLEVDMVERVPFIHKKRLTLFHKSVTNLFIAVMPYSSKFKKNWLNGEDLDKFSWLSLEEIQESIQENDQFICFLVSNKNNFIRNLNFRLGTKISYYSLKNILNKFNEVMPISIIKLEYPEQKTFLKLNLLENQAPG